MMAVLAEQDVARALCPSSPQVLLPSCSAGPCDHTPLSLLSPLWHLPRLALGSARESRWGRRCSHGDLGVSASTTTTSLGLDLGPAGRPSPALPRDTWRWLEITSQELGLSCGPLGNEAASGCPVRSLARRAFLLLHTRALTVAHSGTSG